MSETTALYRKYRPEKFSEVRDQDHIVSVLEGAITKGTLPHALLFSGTRGTGKTTLARIFAHEIGTKEVDIYEIDAASNRGIEHIRELKEAVHTLPYESTHKVYIIDEVHMLTKDAFNALLKTLEEPPAHVLFILATTEEDKILDTVLSRCQIFRMRSPSKAVLSNMVVEVAEKESFTMTPEAADLIAVAADGSFRDALSIMQKVVLSSSDAVGDIDEVAMIIGAPKSTVLRTLIQAIHDKDVEVALEAVREVVEAHTDMKLFSRLFLEHLRAVMLVRNVPARMDDILSQFPDDTATLLKTISAQDTPINSHLLLQFIDAASRMQRSPLPHLALEVAIVDVCTA